MSEVDYLDDTNAFLIDVVEVLFLSMLSKEVISTATVERLFHDLHAAYVKNRRTDSAALMQAMRLSLRRRAIAEAAHDAEGGPWPLWF